MPTVNFLMLITFSKHDLMLADRLTTNLQWTMRHTNVFFGQWSCLHRNFKYTSAFNNCLHYTAKNNPQSMLHRKQQKYKIHRYKKYKVYRNKKKTQSVVLNRWKQKNQRYHALFIQIPDGLIFCHNNLESIPTNSGSLYSHNKSFS